MIYFSDFFGVTEESLEEYGSFNISLINDMPLFIDPFLLFGSDKPEYQNLHAEIITYIKFLKQKAEQGNITDSQIKSWYLFPEVKQNWFGYSSIGNKGSGLGWNFGKTMSKNLHLIFPTTENKYITQTLHLEKACLFQVGIGKDNISDFTTNLIKNYLLEYTQNFAKQHLNKSQVKKINVNKAHFNYQFERWMPKQFELPYMFGDYVILTPKDVLTKDENWINSHDLRGDFSDICASIPNGQLRSEIYGYFLKSLPAPKDKKQTTTKEKNSAINKTISQFPELIDYYIKYKEENKIGAKNISQQKVLEVESVFIKNVSPMVEYLKENTHFYRSQFANSYDEAKNRVLFLKSFIENNDGYRLFYYEGNPIKREADLQVIYRLTWYASPFDINREVNNGRGPVDYAVSRGSNDKSLVEFKLASNSKLKMNLENQVKIYQNANNTNKSIKVILFFDFSEYQKVIQILKDLKLEEDESIVLIDARKDNKISASNVKTN